MRQVPPAHHLNAKRARHPPIGEPGADQLREFEAAGADHVQLVVDPITRDSIEWLADVVAAFDPERFTPR